MPGIRRFVFVALGLLWATGSVRAQTWDVSRDFTVAGNPNGPWAYGSVGDRHAAIDLYDDTAAVPAAYNTSQLAGWSSPALGVAPYVLKNVSVTDWNYDGTSVGGGPAVLKPGQVLLHPSSLVNRYTIVRWTAPRSGIFVTSATFTRFEQAQGYNSDYAVLMNGVDLAGATGILTGFGNPDSTATYTSPELVLNTGDTISFAVGYGTDGTHNTDGNTLDAVIRSVDGFGDLILQNQSDHSIAVLSLDGISVVSSATTRPTLPVNWRVAGTGDFNGDGRRDIVVQNTQTRAVSILYMKGTLVQSSAPVNPTLPANWQVMAAGDIDGDGKPDLIVQNTATQQIAVLFMDGATILRSRSFSRSLLPNWNVVGAADFNGDGHTDLVVQNASTRQASILTLNGLTITGSVALNPTLPAGWFIRGVGDFNSDGKPDLVVQNGSTGQISVLTLVDMKIMASYSVNPTAPAGWALVGP